MKKTTLPMKYERKNASNMHAWETDSEYLSLSHSLPIAPLQKKFS